MEIDSHQMEEFLRIQSQQTTETNRQRSAGSGLQFDAFLSEALTSSQDGAKTNGALGAFLPQRAGQAEMVTQMLLNPIEQAEGVKTIDDELLERAFTSASGTLDLWDSYAQTLGSSKENDALKNASSILDTITKQVAQLKSNAASMQAQNSGLNSLINELEIMATTERTKFNRGDYL
ncbi:MAG: hypothetical protein IK079_06530 [Desulfovibrio sp.]|nr:hypothetical protein [Desulfovibrio sp.]